MGDSEASLALNQVGFYKFGSPVFGADEFLRLREVLYGFLQSAGGVAVSQNHTQLMLKIPLLFKWVLSSSLLDKVQEVVGPDITFVSGSLFYKAPGSKEITYWHDDRRGFTKKDALIDDIDSIYNFLIAIDPALQNSGALRYIPGSHLSTFARETEIQENSFFEKENPYSVKVSQADAETAVSVPLGANEMSVHNMGVIHSSDANSNPAGRCLLSVKCVSAAVKVYPAHFTEKNSLPPFLLRGRDVAGSGLQKLNTGL